MQFSLTLVDINARMAAAWRSHFPADDCPEVRIVHGSILRQQADAWVTPTNSRGSMDGGLDAVLKRYLGGGIESRVRREIAQRHDGRLAVGRATCVATEGLWAPPDGAQPRYVISTPTMNSSSQNVSGTLNVAWGFAAALQAAHLRNLEAIESGEGAVIRSIAVPGLGAATGRVPPETCAAQMYAAYRLMRDWTYEDWDSMRAALSGHFGDPGTRPAARKAPPTPGRRLLGIFPVREKTIFRFA